MPFINHDMPAAVSGPVITETRPQVSLNILLSFYTKLADNSEL